MSLREVLRPIGHPVVQAMRYPLDKWKDFSAKRSLIKLKDKKKCRDVVRVGFIVQIAGVWDKEKSIFERMCADSRFEPYLIIVPNYDVINCKVGQYDDDKIYFLNEVKNKGDALLAYQKGSWININELGFDYIFYGRPYDALLPHHLRSEVVVKYSKTCYVPYATPENKDTVTRPRAFFRNLYIGFLEDYSSSNSMQLQFKKNCMDRLQHFVSVGYPVFEQCMKLASSCKYKKVMWAPRWTYDKIVGGSHFFEYVQELEAYSWGDAEFMIRPHPLMWDNFIRLNLCDREYIDERRIKWNELGVCEDENKNIEESFKDTDILITDPSSVIAMFFMTTKPIIFCPKEPYNQVELSSLLNTIIPGLYIARNWMELKQHLDTFLREHKDPLRKKRLEILRDNFKESENATDNIVEYVYNDFLKEQ